MPPPPANSFFPTAGLLPKDVTQASAFLLKNPDYDGRGVTIAILDTGVDPAAPGLQVTSHGLPKLVDIVDCTGAGDVAMDKPVKIIAPSSDSNSASGARHVVGKSGRKLELNPAWNIPSNHVRLGLKRAKDIFPYGVYERVINARQKTFLVEHTRLVNDAIEGQTKAANNIKLKAEYTDRIEALKALLEARKDHGPIFDVVAFHDGTHWRVAIDVAEDGNLSNSKALASYRFEREFSRFSDVDNLTYSVNVYDHGSLVSIVSTAGSHGTHVAAITAANFPNEPALNGVAPGAQIVSLKIGDTRLGSMETGAGFTRAILAMVQNGVQLANMSYGEAPQVPNVGTATEFLREYAIRRHNIVFVSSAGNCGPALSTVGAPGGSTSRVISVGAYVGPDQIVAEYNNLSTDLTPMEYTWSSRGPTVDGDYGVTVLAPGSAITSVPICQLSRSELMNGTSMASPNACGCIALLMSGWNAENKGKKLTPERIVKTIQNTGKPVESDIFKRPLIRVDDAFQHLIKFKDHAELDVFYKIRCANKKRGVYLRSVAATACRRNVTIEVIPEYSIPPVCPDWSSYMKPEPENPDDSANKWVATAVANLDEINELRTNMDLRLTLVPSDSWIRTPEFFYLSSSSRGMEVQLELQTLQPGVHSGYIDALDTSCREKGPLFRIPVTICKPVPFCLNDGGSPCHLNINNIKTSPGSVHRTFVDVPLGASFVDVSLTAQTSADVGFVQSLVYMRMVQLLPQETHESAAHSVSLRLGAEKKEKSTVGRFKVHGGVLMEFLLIQNWNQRASHNVDIELDFHGINITTPVMYQAEAFNRVLLSSNLRREKNIDIQVSSKCLRRTISAASAEVKALSLTRDMSLAGRPLMQLLLTYNFEITMEKQSVTPYILSLHQNLYSSPVDGYLLLIYDAYKQHIATQDIYPKSVELRRGSYTVRVQIRHYDHSLLETLKTLKLALDCNLPAAIKFELFGSRENVFYSMLSANSSNGSRSNENFNITLEKGAIKPFYMKVPEFKDANVGDYYLAKCDVTDCKKGYVLNLADFGVAIVSQANAKKEKLAAGPAATQNAPAADVPTESPEQPPSQGTVVDEAPSETPASNPSEREATELAKSAEEKLAEERRQVSERMIEVQMEKLAAMKPAWKIKREVMTNLKSQWPTSISLNVHMLKFLKQGLKTNECQQSNVLEQVSELLAIVQMDALCVQYKSLSVDAKASVDRKARDNAKDAGLSTQEKLMQRANDVAAEERKDKKSLDERKSAAMRALLVKADVLLRFSGEEALKEETWAEIETAMAMYKSWCPKGEEDAVGEVKYLRCLCRQSMRDGRAGYALKQVIKQLRESGVVGTKLKQLRKIHALRLELLRHLEYDCWVEQDGREEISRSKSEFLVE